MYITRQLGGSSSKSHRNVDAVDFPLCAAANGAESDENVRPVDGAALSVPDILMEAGGSQRDTSIS